MNERAAKRNKEKRETTEKNGELLLNVAVEAPPQLIQTLDQLPIASSLNVTHIFIFRHLILKVVALEVPFEVAIKRAHNPDKVRRRHSSNVHLVADHAHRGTARVIHHNG